MYYSAYLDWLRRCFSGFQRKVWCIFDNTVEGAATHDALVVVAEASGPDVKSSSKLPGPVA